MRRVRFTIGTLLILVLFLGVSFAALREASDLWDAGTFNLAIAVLLASILLTVHGTGASRAFWLGFALCGSTYMALTLFPWAQQRLVTTDALVFLNSKLPARPAGLSGRRLTNSPNLDAFVAQSSPVPGTPLLSFEATPMVWDESTGMLVAVGGRISDTFVRIGHSLLALATGCMGGLFSRYLHSRRGKSALPYRPLYRCPANSGQSAPPDRVTRFACAIPARPHARDRAPTEGRPELIANRDG